MKPAIKKNVKDQLTLVAPSLAVELRSSRDSKEESSEPSSDEIVIKLYDELEAIMRNKPVKFSQMEYVATSINRLDELEDNVRNRTSGEPEEPEGVDAANLHRLIIFVLILHHSVSKDGIFCKNKLPYHMEYVGKKRTKNQARDPHEATVVTLIDKESKPVRCVLEKIPPVLQNILLGYVVEKMVKKKT